MPFIHEDFLLAGKTARRLYHQYAEPMPILDYHCHLNPQDIAQDTAFDNLASIWLDNDHYKWTAMRCAGIPERLITGDACGLDKLTAYARALTRCIGNPLHHWSHLELARYFGYTEPLTPVSATKVWDTANQALRGGLTARACMRRANVRLVCTTDDPVDDLRWHKQIRDEGFEIRVLPAFRPDKAMDVTRADYTDYLRALSAASGVDIGNLDALEQALSQRMDTFADMGCKLSDHGLTRIDYEPMDAVQADAVLRKRLAGADISEAERRGFSTHLLLWLARQYHQRGWVMQLHYGVLRDINPTLMTALGVDAGGDAISGASSTDALAGLLGDLEGCQALPKTILYSINPQHNIELAVLAGCFQSGEARGKIQHGSAWWFNDSKLGMETQLKTLASVSALGSFVGMLTDSRSFLSYTRHEYFRRILCNYLGELVDAGEYPLDWDLLGGLIADICYHNAQRYFDF